MAYCRRELFGTRASWSTRVRRSDDYAFLVRHNYWFSDSKLAFPSSSPYQLAIPSL